MRTLMITLTWAFAIPVGIWLLTPEGPIPIVLNSLGAQILGVLGIAIGAYHIYEQFIAPRREESIAGR